MLLPRKNSGLFGLERYSKYMPRTQVQRMGGGGGGGGAVIRFINLLIFSGIFYHGNDDSTYFYIEPGDSTDDGHIHIIYRASDLTERNVTEMCGEFNHSHVLFSPPRILQQQAAPRHRVCSTFLLYKRFRIYANFRFEETLCPKRR